jgi:hypothetical protein
VLDAANAAKRKSGLRRYGTDPDGSRWLLVITALEATTWSAADVFYMYRAG